MDQSVDVSVTIDNILSGFPDEFDQQTPVWAKHLVGAFKSLCVELGSLNNNLLKRVDTLEVRNAANEARIISLETQLAKKKSGVRGAD